MQFDRNRMSPEPKNTSFCECCNGKIIAKCGKVNIWHWAHESKEDCDPWYEPITEWHLGWQSCVPVEMREIFMKNEREKHRADIKLPNGIIVEIQHSGLDEETICEREDFYGNMIWILDGTNLFSKMNRYEKVSKYGNEYVSWYYSYRAKQWVEHFTKQMYLDFGDKILRVNIDREEGLFFVPIEKETYDQWDETRIRKKFRGWGKHLTRQEAKREIFGQFYVEPQQELFENKVDADKELHIIEGS